MVCALNNSEVFDYNECYKKLTLDINEDDKSMNSYWLPKIAVSLYAVSLSKDKLCNETKHCSFYGFSFVKLSNTFLYKMYYIIVMLVMSQCVQFWLVIFSGDSLLLSNIRYCPIILTLFRCGLSYTYLVGC